MASYDKRTRTIVRREYALTSPTHISEFNKAVSAASFEIKSMYGHHKDDLIQVEARDDEVVIFWLAESESSTKI